jgi:hypothetical protein
LRAAVRHPTGDVIAQVLIEVYEQIGHTEQAAEWGQCDGITPRTHPAASADEVIARRTPGGPTHLAL